MGIALELIINRISHYMILVLRQFSTNLYFKMKILAQLNILIAYRATKVLESKYIVF